MHALHVDGGAGWCSGVQRHRHILKRHLVDQAVGERPFHRLPGVCRNAGEDLDHALEIAVAVGAAVLAHRRQDQRTLDLHRISRCLIEPGDRRGRGANYDDDRTSGKHQPLFR